MVLAAAPRRRGRCAVLAAGPVVLHEPRDLDARRVGRARPTCSAGGTTVSTPLVTKIGRSFCEPAWTGTMPSLHGTSAPERAAELERQVPHDRTAEVGLDPVVPDVVPETADVVGLVGERARVLLTAGPRDDGENARLGVAELGTKRPGRDRRLFHRVRADLERREARAAYCAPARRPRRWPLHRADRRGSTHPFASRSPPLPAEDRARCAGSRPAGDWISLSRHAGLGRHLVTRHDRVRGLDADDRSAAPPTG